MSIVTYRATVLHSTPSNAAAAELVLHVFEVYIWKPSPQYYRRGSTMGGGGGGGGGGAVEGVGGRLKIGFTPLQCSM